MVAHDSVAASIIEYLREVGALTPSVESAILSNDLETIRNTVATEPLVDSCRDVLQSHIKYLETVAIVRSLTEASEGLQVSMNELVATAQRFEDAAKDLERVAVKLQQTHNLLTMEFMVDL